MLGWLLRLLIGCRHKWVVKDRTDMPSPIEQLAKVGLTPKSFTTIHLFTKQATTVLACSECGKLQIVRTRNLTRWD